MTLTREQVLELLRAKVSYGTKIKDLAAEFEVSAAFMSSVLAGKKTPNGQMLASIGVRRIEVFEMIDQEGS
ncbi:MAG: hypothetical protein AAGK00_18495 [Pseudomonadota bacterium]